MRFRGQSIADMSAQPISAAHRSSTKLAVAGREQEIARDILAELSSRLGFLEQVGLGYLSLDRGAPTLSGGEAQRIRLAAQLGSNLRGVCYILDEPTIGLHPRDNQILLDTLAKLGAKGNTLVVVEHDEDTIRRAEHVIDLGPGAGTPGRAHRRARHGRGAEGESRLDHRPFPARAAEAPAAAAPRGGEIDAGGRDRGREAAQSERRRRALPARAALGRDRRVRIGQVHASRATCCTRTCSGWWRGAADGQGAPP